MFLRIPLLLRRRRGRVPWVRGQQGQPGPAANGHGHGGQAAAVREWAELIPVPRPRSAVTDSTSGAGTAQENRA